MSIFKAYDIRGIYPDELDETIAQKIGRAIILFFRQKKWPIEKIVIGQDARLSSPKLFQGVVRGLLIEEPKIKIINLDQCSTPFLYWAIQNNRADGGLMITASHNPSQFNGFKICRQGAASLGGAEIQEIGEIVERLNESKENPSLIFFPSEVNIKDYFSFLLKKIDISKIKPFRVAIDCGNGMLGPEIEEIISQLPIQSKVLYAQPDGRFPHHLANPLDENTLVELKELIAQEGFDFGAAFDGDGDRIGIIDENGEVVRGDFILALLSEYYLKKFPGEKIVYEVRSSKVIPETIKINKGISILSRAGHSFIKKKMRKEEAVLGGELSGHYFYRELGFVDNALFTFLHLLEIFSQQNKPVSQIIRPFQKYFQSGEINFRVENKEKILRRVEKKYSDGEIIKVDGLTVIYSRWWFNLRPSNTENLLRLNLEADTLDLMKEKTKEIEGLISK